MKKLLTSLIIISTIIFGMVSNGTIATDVPTNTEKPILIETFDRSTWWWTETEVISADSTGASYSPELAVDSENNIHMVWYDYTDYLGCGIDGDIFYRKLNTVSNTWSTTEVVSTESTIGSVAPSLTVDSNDNIHVVWHDATDYLGSGGGDYDIFYKKLDTSTNLWGITEVVSIESSSISYDASVVVDPSGDVYVAWEESENDDGEGDRDIYFKKRDAGTDSWGTAEDLSFISDENSYDPNLGIDSSGDIHIAWVDLASYDFDIDFDIIYKYWDSATDSWSATEVLSVIDVATSEFVSLDIDSDDNIHVAWADAGDFLGSGAGENDVFYKYKLASSGTWSVTELTSSQSTLSSRDVYVKVDSSGYVHVAYRDSSDIYMEAGGDYDILYNVRDPLTGSWSPIHVISSESTSNSWDPSIAVDETGQVHMVWYDPTDYDSAGTDEDIFYKKLVGPPQVPLLFPIIPNPRTTGTINIDWSDVVGCDNYYLYRENSYITSLTGLSAYNVTTESSTIDTISENGTYYYVVVAENEYGLSPLSNEEIVQVDLAENGTDLLSFISNEILIVGGILLGTQIIFFVLSILIKRSGSSKPKGKRKK